MLGTLARFTRQVRRPALAAVAISALVLPTLSVASYARGPEGVADIAEQVIDAVVNISTSQNVAARNNTPMPQLPNDPQLDELFRDFFNRRGQQDGENQNRRGQQQQAPRRVNSLGSGFIIDAGGIVVTNNHVIADADEITVILNDGTRIKAELIGKDTKVDLALLRIKSEKPLKAVKFGDSDKLRLGEWVVAIGNPFSLGGTVTAGIVSARNRDINSGPYDNYIQTDAAINRGNSGGPLFNLDGEVIGINTAIISPSGGSIGIGFAVPSKTARAVIDQLKEFGETRRGWLGVRIQQVTDEIAESLSHQAGTRRAGRRHRREGSGQARRHRGRRRDRQVRRQGHQGDEGPAARGRRYAGRQGRAGDRHPQGPGRDQDRQAWPARGRRKAGLAHTAEIRFGADARHQEDARPRPCQSRSGPAQEIQGEGHREGRRHPRCRFGFAGCRQAAHSPATSSSRSRRKRSPIPTTSRPRSTSSRKRAGAPRCSWWPAAMASSASWR